MIPGSLVIGGYLAIVLLSVWAAFALTRPYQGRWQRNVAVSLVLAFFLAPSFVGGGHGGAPAPAWAAAGQQLTEVGGSMRGFWLAGIAPMVVTFGIFFVTGLARSLLKKTGR